MYMQMTFLDLLESCANVPLTEFIPPISRSEKNPVKDNKRIIEETLNKGENYLYRGTRLVSIAKQHYEERLSDMSLSDIEKKLFSLELPQNLEESVTMISNKVVLPFLRMIETSADAEKSPLVQCFDESLTVRLTYPLQQGSTFGNSTIPDNGTRFSKVHPEMIGVTILEDGRELLHTIGLKNAHMPKNRKCCVYKSYPITLCDIPCLLSYLIVISYAQRELASYEDIYHSKYANYLSFHPLMKESSYPPKVLSLKEDKDFFSGKKWYFRTVGNSSDLYVEQCDLIMEYMQNVYGFDMGIQTEIKTAATGSSEVRTSPTDNVEKKVPVFTGSFIDDYPLKIHFLDFYKYGSEKYGKPYRVSYATFLSKAKHNLLYPLPLKHYGYLDCLFSVFRSIHESKKDMVSMMKYFSDLKGTYSKSFQTLKNHSQKMLAEMQNSVLNEYFGFVELDEDVDISKCQEIMKQFIAWKEKIVPGADAHENAIRFRKLGNHHASGLYYPFINCMCVDYRMCYSFIHEFGHLIDYTYGELSMKPDFYMISTMYKARLAEVAKTTSFTGKYNLSYFCTPTEIFARSFELYNAKIKGIHNSLLPQKFGVEYPQDEEFMATVRAYFDTLLKTL